MIKKFYFLFLLLCSCFLLIGCSLFNMNNEEEKKEPQYQIYLLAESSGYTGTYEEWLASIRGESGTPIELDVLNDYLCWRYVGTESFTPLYDMSTLKGEKGDSGLQGEPGKNGVGIIKIEKTTTNGLEDTYTIFLSDGTTTTFVVKNGSSGSDGGQGIQGQPGQNGKSAYQLYKDAHPEYTKTESEWLEDLVNGRLVTKEEVKYTIIFNSNGGTNVANQQVNEFGYVTKPTDPTKDGYTFDGWFIGDEKWSFSANIVAKDITLTAKWTPIDYEVKFINDDGSVLYELSQIHYGESIEYGGVVPEKVQKEAHYTYTFNGWDKDLVVTGDMIIKAQYKSEYCLFEERYLDVNENIIYSRYIRENDLDNIMNWNEEIPTKPDDGSLTYQFSKWLVKSNENDIITYYPYFETATSGLEFDGNKVEAYHGTSDQIVIPTYWNGHTITSIANNAFAKTNITKVELPDSLIDIGEQAFYQCTKLSSIVLPSSVLYIGRNAFQDCCNLVNVKLNEGLKEIRYHAFERSGVKNVIIPSTVTKIYDNAFRGIEADFIYIPSTVEIIEWDAFTSLNGYSNKIYCERKFRPSTYDANWANDSIIIWGCESLSVDLLSDLPQPNADYYSEHWTKERYTDGWETGGDLRSREKDGVRVVNMSCGYGITMRYTYNNGGSPLGIANKLSFKIGNYFTNADVIRLKIGVIDSAGNKNFILGTSDEFYEFPVTTGLIDQEIIFDAAEIVSVYFVLKSSINGNAFLYVGDLYLTFGN